MSVLNLGPGFTVPIEAATETFGILAVKRSGKSNAGVVMAEEMFGAGIPWVAVDPKGDWYGLRSSGDGKGPGLPIVVFGGEHGDVPLEPTAGRLVADLVAEKHLTCVLDVSLMSKADMRRFLTDFAVRLYRVNREALHLFCEEADEYIPQRVDAASAGMVGAFETLVKRGGFRGIGVTLITQRSASLNKDVTTQIGTLIALRTTGPQDRKVIEDWVKYHDLGLDAVSTLSTLKDGEAWVFSPQWLGKLERVKFRRRRTFDSGATPKVGQRRAQPVTLAAVDLAAIKEQMADTIERAKADDPKELRHRIRDLERQLAEVRPVVETVVEHVQVVPAELVDALAEIRDDLVEFTGHVVGRVNDVSRVLAEIGAAPAPLTTDEAADRIIELGGEPATPLADLPVSAPQLREEKRSPGPAPEGIGASHRKILDALAWLGSMGLSPASRVQVGYLAGYTASGGTFQKYVSTLRTAGLVDFPSPGKVWLTPDGTLLADPPTAPLTDAALQEAFYARLPAPLAKILRHLVEMPLTQISRAALGEATGYEASGGTFQKYLSTLSSLGLVEYPDRGWVAPSDVLFLEGGR